MRKDQRGLTLSTTSAEAAAAYREGLDLMLAAWPGALAAFDRALAADPGFAAAHLARGRQLQIMGRVAEGKQAVAAARAALCDAVAAHYRDDWWFEGYRGWSYAEAGALAAGLAHLQRALELRPCNANAVHGLAHARHDRGEIDEGRRETETFLPHYDRAGTLNAHLAWHLALFALERDDVAAALDLYESRIAPDVSQAPPLNTLTDSASLLWRVLLRDPARPLPWEEVAAYGAERFATAGLAFADLHAALLEAVTGRRETLTRRLAALEALVATGRLPAGPVVPVLCRGFAAFAAGAYDEAADLLVPALPDAARIGGSGAQRDMIEDTAIAACLRAGRQETARTILRRRFARPASPLP
ncbi:hypothetical protein [Elioraea sp.]|uniref:hypothetical protein n=1 Tax=Elioraea sp. TaxID=2185103 RepID=UPI0021DE53B7|nr:hypothetical protein [Elioraea sp.]GIX11391.1 MAG: hypothetical protein KatS3mg116_3101 [Elioraea sp.]